MKDLKPDHEAEGHSEGDLSPPPESQNDLGQKVPVLYQKLGSQWYLFSLIDEELYYTRVAEPPLDETEEFEPTEHR